MALKCPFMSDSTDTVDCMESACRLWVDNDCVFKLLDNIQQVVEHKHKSHDHARMHASCTDLDVACGKMADVEGMKMPKANKLIFEYQAYEDMDDNDLIYGKDFIISGDMPPMLKSFQDNIHPKPTTVYDWNDYLDGTYI